MPEQPLDESVSAMTRVGDLLQSEASRVAEWVEAQADVPYEVSIAAMEVRHAVDEWTEIRRTPR